MEENTMINVRNVALTLHVSKKKESEDMPDATGNQDGIVDIALRMFVGISLATTGLLNLHNSGLFALAIGSGVYFIHASFDAFHERKISIAKEVAEKL